METKTIKIKSDSQETKKPYHSPEMVTYGSVPEITKGVGTTSVNGDGSTMTTTKTA